jgi:hypothetical protein
MTITIAAPLPDEPDESHELGELDAMLTIFRKYDVPEEVIDDFLGPYGGR